MLPTLAQAGAAAVVARPARARPPPPAAARRRGAPTRRVSVVIPARDEERPARRLPRRRWPAIPTCSRSIVVDDRSSDAHRATSRARTAPACVAGARAAAGLGRQAVGAAAGARGRGGRRRRLARRRHAPAARARRRARAARCETADFVTAGARFVCDTAGRAAAAPVDARLARLPLRAGRRRAARRAASLANGQVTAVERERLLAAGGYAAAAGHMTDDAALARALAARRLARRLRATRRRSSTCACTTRAAETWREWGRSLALPDVTPPAWQAADLAVVWLTHGAAGAARSRRAGRRGSTSRCSPCACALLPALAGSYARRGPAFWLSPLADPATAVRLTLVGAAPGADLAGADLRGAPRTAAPISDMSAPVPITCATGSVASWTNGKANTPTRAPHVNERRRGDRAAEREADARRERRERERAADEAHHRLAAAEAGEERERVADHRAGHGGEAAPPARRAPGPARPAAKRLARRRRGTRAARAAARAARARSTRPGLPSPVARRSTPWRRATSSATGIDPSR